MPDIYDQHKAAFANVSAYVIAKDGERVASIAFKYPRDGAGRLYAYVHWFGIPMIRGYAGGYGYDKHSAAVANAVGNAIKSIKPLDVDFPRTTFFRELATDGGEYWNRRLEKAGFTVWQAV